jgi:hypothetical protein
MAWLKKIWLWIFDRNRDGQVSEADVGFAKEELEKAVDAAVEEVKKTAKKVRAKAKK